MADFYVFDVEDARCWVTMDEELVADFADADRDHEARRRERALEGAQRFRDALERRYS